MYTSQIIFTLIAVAMLQIFSIAVSKARYEFGIKAPSTTGNVEFEKISRTHLNHLENMAIFIPLVWTAGIRFGSNPYYIGLCVAWVVGRLLFSYGYINSLSNNFKLVTNVMAVVASVSLAILSVVGLF
jgi:glutathione S-transferase